jgi:hypothetical protein
MKHNYICEQNKEDQNRKYTNKTQQRRRKGHAIQNTQDNPSEEDVHEEGDRMRATQGNPSSRDIYGEGDEMRDTQNKPQEAIHEEEDEMRATNAGAFVARTHRTSK